MSKQKTSLKDLSGQKILDELKTPGLIILGVVGGNIAGKAIDKLLKADDSTTTISPRKLAKPVIQLTAGLAGSLLLKDKNLKLIASGVTASGVISSVKVLLKKDLLDGFKGVGDIRDDIQVERYDPDLPELGQGMRIEKIPVEKQKGNFDQYEEINEVEIL